MTSIQGFAELIRDEDLEPADRRDYADLLGPSPDGDPTAQPDPVQPAASGSPAPG